MDSDRIDSLSDEEMRYAQEQRQDRIAEMTPARCACGRYPACRWTSATMECPMLAAQTPSSLPPRVLLRQRQNRERLELLRRHEAEQVESHEPDCPRPAHGGPCHGPLRFELAETSLELYERRIEAIEAVLSRTLVDWGLQRPADRALLRELAEACYVAGDLGI